MAQFVLTEEQYRLLEDETIKIPAEQNQKPTEKIGDTVTRLNTQMQQKGVNAQVTANTSNTQQNSQTGTVNCSRIITKRQIEEMKVKKLRENSKLYTLKDFIGR